MLVKALVLLLTLSTACAEITCHDGPNFAADYALERAAVWQAVHDVAGRSVISRDELEAIPVIPVLDIDAECGSDPKGRRTIACFCETPFCREILISGQDVGHERTSSGVLMVDVMLHEYTHAVLPTEAGHAQLFGAVRAKAREIRRVKDPWTFVSP